MVYRIAGVYRHRIDEILPYFRGATIREDPDETIMLIPPTEPEGAQAEVRAMPAGFYVHWWAERRGLDGRLAGVARDDAALRELIYTHIARWTSELYEREMYADFSRKTGDLVVGRFRLVPFAADPGLSARLIDEGLREVSVYRDRVEELVRTSVSAMATERPATA